MKCIYLFDYEKDKDKFTGYVMTENGNTVFEFKSTEDIILAIEAGEMDHIDDVKGLENMLRHDGILEDGDTLELGSLQ